MSKRRQPSRQTRPAARSGQGRSRNPGRSATVSRVAKVGKVSAVAGGVLFVLGNIGARTGWVLFPFDSHHVISQFGGIALLIVGVALAGRR